MAEIRQALAQCFKELMQEKSFQKIIVKEITDRANVKRPTFYTYFRDKYDVVEWIFMQEIWQPANSLIAAGYIREGLRFMLISMEKDKRYYRKLAALEGQNSFQEIFVRCIRQEVEQALRENAFHPSHHLLSVELWRKLKRNKESVDSTLFLPWHLFRWQSYITMNFASR